MRRTLILGFGVLLVVAAAAAGWIAGSRIRSPEQAAAEAEPPEPSLITVPVELTVIATEVVTRGDVRFDRPEPIVATGLATSGLAPIITMIPEPGSGIEEGDLLYEVSGRPVFALFGDVPLFRPLFPGAEGEDVAQFQQALLRLGFDPGEIDGVYGSNTAHAAADLYAAAGYDLAGAGPDEMAALQAAEAAAAEARLVRDAARAAAAETTAAEDALATAREQSAAAAQVLDDAEAALQQATVDGLDPDGPQATALQAVIDAARQANEAAMETLEQAEADAAAARRAATGTEVAAAEQAWRVAADGLAAAAAAAGPRIPIDEVAFFPTFPLRVDRVQLERGDPAQGEVMTVSGSRLAIDSSVPVDDAARIDVGDSVVIDIRDRGIELTGRVSEKADRPGTEGLDAQQVYLEIEPDEARTDLADANVRITIPVESTGGEVLAVPAAAISAVADGSARVQVAGEDGTTRFVTVVPGLAAAGLVEVTPVRGDLAPGDRVVVGTS